MFETRDKGKDVGTRIGSMILDHFIMTFASMIIGVVLSVLILLIVHLFVEFESMQEVFPILIATVGLTVYPVYFNKDAIEGKSPAKRILKLIVVNNKTNEVASPIRTVARNCTIFFWPVEVLFVLFSPDRRLGDYIAGTRVVEDDKTLKRKPKPIELVFSFLLGVAFMLPLLSFFVYFGGFRFPIS